MADYPTCVLQGTAPTPRVAFRVSLKKSITWHETDEKRSFGLDGSQWKRPQYSKYCFRTKTTRHIDCLSTNLRHVWPDLTFISECTIYRVK